MNSDNKSHSTSGSDLVAQSWARFLKTITSEQLAVDVLYELIRRTSAPTCIRCGSQNHDREEGSRILICLDCGREASFTAQTFFHSAKKLRPWLGVFFLTETGLEFSVRRFSILAKISYGTAWCMFKKVDFVTTQNFETNSCAALSSDFLEVLIKRSRETLAKNHPTSEQNAKETEENGKVEHEDFPPGSSQARESKPPNSPTDNLSSEESKIWQAISDCPIDFEDLHRLTGLTDSVISSALSILEICGFVKRVEGDKYIRSLVAKVEANTESTFLDDTSDTVGEFLSYVKRQLHGISRKYLQFHIAKFWYLIDILRWGAGELFVTCLKHGRIIEPQISSYSSPLIVQLPKQSISPAPFESTTYNLA